MLNYQNNTLVNMLTNCCHEYFEDVKRSIELLEKLQMSGEIPATKLAALQKVLQSDFLNAVREVYEHVYETVDIQQGSQDVRASATAKATVGGFICHMNWVTQFALNLNLRFCCHLSCICC